ncbi:Female-specific protein transformer, putative [Perkinsus marinus ATCC 50983]|uniref:Female-specific protein transformer, putative n=1 Tax=Perkinsus marinus (strain ATCC 50983 / TXsc) TaxID=423536 RepID=C5LBW6_PERM5|nr:Female-specific protein transformer, putative [Perkinsus marinus ATCC 50983]EER05937.1 Female-specific protein transformer, putative [Perkinsus marinus ATCC 50983]|eukprot:XP_002774121.1 Female-specific protein transformer, putative [Perkinsus marinus ATCC 50983]
MDNPLLLGRSEQSEPSGPSIEDRIAERQKTGLTWEEFKAQLASTESRSARYLERFENEEYRKNLDADRDHRRAAQEKRDLEALRRARRIRESRKKRSLSASSDSGDDRREREKRKKSKRSSSRTDRKSKSSRRSRSLSDEASRSRKKKAKKEKKNKKTNIDSD